MAIVRAAAADDFVARALGGGEVDTRVEQTVALAPVPNRNDDVAISDITGEIRKEEAYVLYWRSSTDQPGGQVDAIRCSSPP